MFRIEIDPGGTLTDCVVFNTFEYTLKRYIKPSTQQYYSEGVLNSLYLTAADHNIILHKMLKKNELNIHGTTIAFNR